MFDEQPDGDLHDECAAEIHRLNTALDLAEVRLRTLFAHWNEFGPEHGFGELIDKMQDAALPNEPKV